jgi:uncharacterized protein YycO
MLQIALCRSKSIGSWAIRALTWSRYSHAVILDGEQVIEAVWPRVRVSNLATLREHHDEVLVVDWPSIDGAPVIAAARSQVGKPYDWRALLGFLVHRDWAQTNAWFCSELVAWSFGQGGCPLFRPEEQDRVTPQDLWMLEPR